MLETTRASALAAWIAGIAPDDGTHAIERALRAHWHERVAAIAAWMPATWRASIEWCAMLIDLPVVQHLARGGASPGWLSDDPLRAALYDEHRRRPPGWRSAARGRSRELGSGRRALAAEWDRRLPDPRDRTSLLEDTIPRHRGATGTRFATPVRRMAGCCGKRCTHGCRGLFRRATLDPAAAFIFLALSALDFERLRGEILRVVAFPRLPLAE
jgi:hypothetical protein